MSYRNQSFHLTNTRTGDSVSYPIDVGKDIFYKSAALAWIRRLRCRIPRPSVKRRVIQGG